MRESISSVALATTLAFIASTNVLAQSEYTYIQCDLETELTSSNPSADVNRAGLVYVRFRQNEFQIMETHSMVWGENKCDDPHNTGCDFDDGRLRLTTNDRWSDGGCQSERTINRLDGMYVFRQNCRRGVDWVQIVTTGPCTPTDDPLAGQQRRF